jgi:hypothetical protein
MMDEIVCKQRVLNAAMMFRTKVSNYTNIYERIIIISILMSPDIKNPKYHDV